MHIDFFNPFTLSNASKFVIQKSRTQQKYICILRLLINYTNLIRSCLTFTLLPPFDSIFQSSNFSSRKYNPLFRTHFAQKMDGLVLKSTRHCNTGKIKKSKFVERTLRLIWNKTFMKTYPRKARSVSTESLIFSQTFSPSTPKKTHFNSVF